MADTQVCHTAEAGSLAPVANPLTPARVLIVGALGSFFNFATLIMYPFGVFAIAVAKTNGWSTQAVAAMLGPALLVNFWTMPVVGWAVTRFHKPRVAVFALTGLGAGVGLLAFAPPSEKLFGITLAVALLLASAANPTVYSALVLETFERRRGLALGSIIAFTGLGMSAIPVVSARLIEAWGWRAAYGILGGCAICVALVSALLLRGRRSVLPRPVRRSLATRQILSAAVRQPTFWIIAGIIFLLAATANSVALHLPLILQERGASSRIGALSVAVIGLTTIVSRPIIGYLIDHLSIRLVLTIMLVGPIAGYASLMLTTGALAGLVSAIGFGLAIGGEFVCLGYMISRAFPMEHFGIIYGWLGLGLFLGQACGPIGISLAVKLAGGYGLSLAMMISGCLLALGLSWSLKESRFGRELTS
jgi:OFA family oxalate/formate antiporter-like MFS transporter